MKKFIAALLVLTMVLSLASVAMAACDIKAGMWVEFKCDSAAYTAAKSSKKTASEVQKGSIAWCEAVCGKYAKLLVNEAGKTYRWFKTADLKPSDFSYTLVVWAKGGKGMSTCTKARYFVKQLKDVKIKVTGHTNLRKNPGMKFKSQGVVEKCDKLKMTGYVGADDRPFLWVEVCKDGKKLWLSEAFADLSVEQYGYILDAMTA